MANIVFTTPAYETVLQSVGLLHWESGTYVQCGGSLCGHSLEEEDGATYDNRLLLMVSEQFCKCHFDVAQGYLGSIPNGHPYTGQEGE